MPQPKKPGSSARKASTGRPAARKPSTGKPAGAKPARKPASPKRTARTRPPDAVTVGAAPKQAPQPAPESADDALRAGLAMLRDLLSRGVVISSELLQETVDEMVHRGRMTRDDAEELVANLVQIGRRQTQDTIAELEAVVERSATRTRRLARSRVRSVAAAARHAPGTDRALRAVDRARRAAGLGSQFPISGYDDLTAAQVKGRLGELSPAELRKVRDHERRNANRKSILAAIEKGLR
jgi:polyhydroxyalkanoate synthesis regulator phasin